MSSALIELTAHEAAARLREREVSSVELTEAYLERIAAVDPRIHAYLRVLREEALAMARAADERLAAGESGPLLGIPIALKDVLTTRGIETTAGSKMLKGYVPPYSATVVEWLREAGAVFLGKTNMDEFAMGSSNEYSAYGPVYNPWDTTRVPGGSSGGSAAAVAADEAALALGTDTGGSIRQPAALCGIVGLKPTYGRVSRYGLIAFASSLDQIGPLTKDVTDAAILLGAIAGHDPCDSTTVDLPVPDYTASLVPDVKGLRLGVPREYFVPGMQPGVEQAVRSAIAALEDMGASVGEVSLPSTEHALATYYIIAPAEASANLARYDGIKYGYSAGGETMWEAYGRTRAAGFGPEVKRRIMIGTYALSSGYYDAYYVKAQKIRTLVKRDFDAVFADYDAVLAPTSPTTAFKLGQKTADPVQMYLSDACTLPVNIAGLPGISLPCGLLEGLPVGLQIITPAFSEETLLRIAFAYEQSGHFVRQRPPLGV
ncbi:MAG TPA: Asp-tRNA(Asn)/Glu-tRNA(Gln) amidotransferase subunit GatA [Chloroflexota bacterium]|nr:Asp-tRNA(Asn)/Glu-tRNA(Gln) amidotransferase subunit GatA [Chloroflexota bacterium]